MRMLLVVATCCVLPLAGCDESRASVAISGPTMGTQYHITIAQPPGDIDVAALQHEIEAELNRINAQMSTYLPNSEISRFNSQNDGIWFDVSPEFASVVKQARRFSEKTEGAFDVTVAPLVNRWHFGPDWTNLDIPSDAELAALKQAVGFRLIEVRDEPPALKKLRRDVQIELSAIAKGFAVDRITQILESRGLNNCMVEIGGEICVRGTTEGSEWRVGIEKPVINARAIQRIVHLRDASLATSGDYRIFIEIDGRRYSHLIDPRTGYPVDHRLASVSVIADDCLSADAWATALMVLGAEHGYELAQRQGIAALLIERTETNFLERATPEFDNIVTAAEAAESGGPASRESSPAVMVFVYTLAAFAFALTGMAIGVMIKNRRLTGSCGGLAGLRDASGRPLCEFCSNPSEECRGPDDPWIEA